LNNVPNFWLGTLVVIDQINIDCIALLEAEDDPPVGAHGNAPITGKLAPQRVQPEAGNVELIVVSLRRAAPACE
jgi:hypothetical protein